MNRYAPGRDIQGQAKSSLGHKFAATALALAFFHLPFIICDLIFASQQTDCVRTYVPGISFNLQTWLRTDAYVRIGLIVFLLLAAILSCISLKLGVIAAGIFSIVLLLYSLFCIAWTIVGAILFWGHLNPSGKCSGGVQIYMHILLILSFLSICCNIYPLMNQIKSLLSMRKQQHPAQFTQRRIYQEHPVVYTQPQNVQVAQPVQVVNPAVPSLQSSIRQTAPYPVTTVNPTVGVTTNVNPLNSSLRQPSYNTTVYPR